MDGFGWVRWVGLSWLGLVGLGRFGLFEVGGLDVFDLLEYSGYLWTVYMYSVQCTVYSVLC